MFIKYFYMPIHEILSLKYIYLVILKKIVSGKGTLGFQDRGGTKGEEFVTPMQIRLSSFFNTMSFNLLIFLGIRGDVKVLNQLLTKYLQINWSFQFKLYKTFTVTTVAGTSPEVILFSIKK